MQLPRTWGEWSAIGAILALAGGLYLHLFTDLEAQELEKAMENQLATAIAEQTVVNRSLKHSLDRSEILRLTREVRRLELDKKEEGADVETINLDIDYYNSIIGCIRAQLLICE
jgi:hypothetical protein